MGTLKIISTLVFILILTRINAQSIKLDTLLTNCHRTTYNYQSVHNDNLQLDWYKHNDYKNDTIQPVIIIMHGGSFMYGSKQSDYCLKFANDWTNKGFQVISIQYRLTLLGKSFHCDLPQEEKLKTFQEATYDLWKATEKIIELSSENKIDTTKIIIAGVSAGAEAVLNAAFMPLSMYKHQNILSKEFKYAGVISYAGAVADTNWITPQSAIPSLLYHGSCDAYVPHRTAPHHYCDKNTPGALMLSGSVDIAQRLRNLSTSYYLYLECESGHSVCKTPIWNQFEDTYDFVNEVILNQVYRQGYEINTNIPGKCKFVEEVLCD